MQNDDKRRSGLRRRRNARTVGITLVLLLIVAAAVLSGRTDDDEPARAGDDSPRAEAEGVACDGPAPPEADPQQYPSPPDLALEPGIDYAAVIDTSCGEIRIDLLEDQAPRSVANFVFLAREGFFDGLIWHRVERNAVIQTGDPNGLNGVPPDGPGYTIPDELPDHRREYVYGTVGMANAGPGTGGSQWFVVIHDREQGRPAGYRADYSIFGRVDEASYDVIDEIGGQPTRGGTTDMAAAVMPTVPIYINSIEIVEG